MGSALTNPRFIAFKNGYYGLEPPTARERDVCCVIFGARTLFIVRAVAGSSGHYEFIEDAYVHGMMKGEIVEMCADGELQEDNTVLIQIFNLLDRCSTRWAESGPPRFILAKCPLPATESYKALVH
ncbi:hypothetical protein K432DRAFT_396717 [Lepidopterella palustris CBS 459.81]|uniref:Uncharacterized protein n=1 Tax=Lepidopterella palustris CBS 459.81 TaxID=1314670 RepID=A0A8E2E2K1_9PEZI|nr:hypothetical protein K432DRAFT_396717 [Lepidopterella palustris CBS 459.81]